MRLNPSLTTALAIGMVLTSQLSGCAPSPKSTESRNPSQAPKALSEASPAETVDSPVSGATCADEAGEAPSEAPSALEEESAEEGEWASDSDAEKKESTLSLPEQLKSEAARFDQNLAPEELSCEGAKPIREAICAIADRICAMDDPGSPGAAKECQEAKKTCTDATKRFRRECS